MRIFRVIPFRESLELILWLHLCNAHLSSLGDLKITCRRMEYLLQLVTISLLPFGALNLFMMPFYILHNLTEAGKPDRNISQALVDDWFTPKSQNLIISS